jgi:hypothetical protein
VTERTERLIRVELPHAVFGLVASGGRVVDAAPIARWTVGKTEVEVAAYYRRKRAACQVVS